MTLTRFEPLGDLVSLRDAMDRLFQDSFIRPSAWPTGATTVAVDLWETADAFRLRADVPGLGADDLKVDVTADGVSISGELRAGAADVPADAWLRRERRAGSFQRTFALPMPIDPAKVEATFANGLLDLVLPKAESVRPRTIKVQAK